MAQEGKWAGRFVGAAIIQGAVAFIVMGLLLYLGVYGVPNSGRIIAGGDTCSVTITNATAGTGTATCSNASTWFIIGMIGYGLVGVLGIAVSALFYQYLESTLRAPYTGWRNFTAWIHLILGGGGASVAFLLMAYGGYLGGAALLPKSVGGLGQNAGYVHTNYLGPLSPYITALLGVALLGFLVGGVGYVTAWWSLRKAGQPAE